MKKILISLSLVLAIGNVALAQDFNQLISDLAKIEGVEYQSLDKDMFSKQLGGAAAAMPAFINKIERIEAIVIEEDLSNIYEKVTAELAKVKKDKKSKYESLLKLKERETAVEIVSKKRKDESDIFVFVQDEDTIVIVKMTGNFDEQDLTDMVKDQLDKVKQFNNP